MAAKKRRTRRKGEPAFYVVAIKRWDWSYSFGVNDFRLGEGPYLELAHLEIEGRLLRPSTVRAELTRLVLMPDKRLNEGNRGRNEPTAIGSLRLHRGTLEALLPIPADALGPLLQMLIAERLHYAVLDGTKLYYGRATVRHFRLDETHDEDDLPLEDA